MPPQPASLTPQSIHILFDNGDCCMNVIWMRIILIFVGISNCLWVLLFRKWKWYCVKTSHTNIVEIFKTKIMHTMNNFNSQFVQNFQRTTINSRIDITSFINAMHTVRVCVRVCTICLCLLFNEKTLTNHYQFRIILILINLIAFLANADIIYVYHK